MHTKKSKIFLKYAFYSRQLDYTGANLDANNATPLINSEVLVPLSKDGVAHQTVNANIRISGIDSEQIAGGPSFLHTSTVRLSLAKVWHVIVNVTYLYGNQV